MRTRTFRVDVERNVPGYWASVPELPGCFVSGETLDELLEAVTEAISLYLTAQDHDEPPDEDAPVDRILTRVTSLQLEVTPDLRPPDADSLSRPPDARKRQAHRDDWPPPFRSDAANPGDEHR